MEASLGDRPQCLILPDLIHHVLDRSVSSAVDAATEVVAEDESLQGGKLDRKLHELSQNDGWYATVDVLQVFTTVKLESAVM